MTKFGNKMKIELEWMTFEHTTSCLDRDYECFVYSDDTLQKVSKYLYSS